MRGLLTLVIDSTERDLLRERCDPVCCNDGCDDANIYTVNTTSINICNEFMLNICRVILGRCVHIILGFRSIR